MHRKVWIAVRRRRVQVGLVLLAVLIVAGTLMVRRSDSSLIVRNIDVGAAAVAVDDHCRVLPMFPQCVLLLLPQ